MLAYDAARNQSVLFGGSATGAGLADTWVWTGAGWSPRAPAHSPPGRFGGAMAYDPTSQVIVLFGGFTGTPSNKPLRDTWIWDGSRWSPQMEDGSPSARSGSMMAYDHARGEVVLFGGKS